MMRPFCLLVLFASISLPLVAQTRPPRFILKADVLSPFQPGLTGALEWRIDEKSGLELQVVWQDFDARNKPWFNGENRIDYAEVLRDSFSLTSLTRINMPAWEIFGDNQPLAYAPEHDPVSILQGRLSYRFVFQQEKSPWRWMLQPGIQVTRYRYWQINTTTRQTYADSEFNIFGVYPYQIRVDFYYRYLRQTRLMQEQEAVFPGIHYAVGLARQFGALEIEGLGTGGLNVNMPYKEALPGVTKGLFVEFQLRLGLCIGREKAPEIPN
jgi:hypothetical protein